MIIAKILLFLFAALIMAADIYTSKLTNGIPGIYESNKRYRLPDGTADIKTMTTEKAMYMIGLTALSAVLDYFGAGIFGYLSFFIAGLVNLPIVLKNWKIYNHHKGEVK